MLRHQPARLFSGVRVLDLLIVFAVVTVSISLGWQPLSNFAIRARVGEALNVADEVKRHLILYCSDAPSGAAVSNGAVGFAPKDTPFIQDVILAGSCAEPSITVLTKDTGASIDPVLFVTGASMGLGGQGPWKWSCLGDGPATHLPDNCRR